MPAEPINPYASPAIPDETAAAEEPVACSDEFTMDEAGLLASARMNTAPIHRWIILTAPVWLLGLAMLFVGMAYIVGAPVAFGCGVLALVSLTLLQAARDRHAAMRTLQLLQDHPVLGAKGRWRLSLAEHHYFLETPGGLLPFTPAQVSLVTEEDYRLLIWFSDRLPIVIPKHPANATMIKQLRRWITASAQTSKSA